VAWQGERDATHFGSRCPYLDGKTVKGEEDCLYLNLYRPRAPAAKPLPVMVWFHGGGNHALSSEGTDSFGGLDYTGAKLTPAGVILVTFNFRLGVLGFLAHPALGHASGNYGSLDQIGLLDWLQKHVAAFGGDPQHIFVFGTSAGGGNICALLSSPLTQGRIHGAAMQSSVPTGCEIQTLAEAEHGTGQRVLAATGCARDKDPAACLRGKSTQELVSAVPGTFGLLPRLYGPVVDGQVFPDQPIARIRARQVPAMPIIIGNTADDTLAWADSVGKITDLDSYAAAISHLFGTAQRDRVLSRYPAAAFTSPRAAFAQLATDALFTCSSLRVGRAFAAASAQAVYRYQFTHALKNDPVLQANGANHTIEHAFLFPGRGTYQPASAELELQKHVAAYWTSMAKQGKPEAPGAAHWPVQEADGDAYLDIGTEPSGRRGPQRANCPFWEEITLTRPHL
jgi:para-nitrobenzyl esterase